MIAYNFSHFKIARLSLYSSASIDVKPTPDPADFAMTRLLIQIFYLAHRAVTAAICQWSQPLHAQTAKTRHLVILSELPQTLKHRLFQVPFKAEF
jgi:hypothetical protein